MHISKKAFLRLFSLILTAACIISVVPGAFASALTIDLGEVVSGTMDASNNTLEFELEPMDEDAYFGIRLEITPSKSREYSFTIEEYKGEKLIRTEVVTSYNYWKNDYAYKIGNTIVLAVKKDKYSTGDYKWVITTPDTNWYDPGALLVEDFNLEYNFSLDPDISWDGWTTNPLDYPKKSSGTGFYYYNGDPDRQYLDGNENSWATDELYEALDKGFVQDELLSDLRRPITREEFAILAARADFIISAGHPKFQGSLLYRHRGTDFYDSLKEDFSINVTFNSFTDCQNEFIDYAASMNYITGLADGSFDPDASITREQAAAVIGRIGESFGINSMISANAFLDRPSFSPWAARYINYLTTLVTPEGKLVMGGVGGNYFEPHSEITREEAIIALNRLRDIITDKQQQSQQD